MGHLRYVGHGDYVAYDGYLALRNVETSEWRLSAVKVSPEGVMTLTYVKSFTHLWEVREYISV